MMKILFETGFQFWQLIPWGFTCFQSQTPNGNLLVWEQLQQTSFSGILCPAAHVCVCDLGCIVAKILNSGLLFSFLYNSVTYLITSICLTLLKIPLQFNYDKLSHIKKQKHHFVNKGPYSQIYGFTSSHNQIWELDHKEVWALKKWCFQIVVLKKTWEPLGLQGD